MNARVNYITLGVSDLERALAFYRDGLGFPTQGPVGSDYHDDLTGASGEVVIFDLDGGLMLVLYRRADLAKDASVNQDRPGSTEFALGLLTKTRQEVDAFLKRAVAAGAKQTRDPHDRPWGVYSGYFLDPDGHLWEITHNPNMIPG